MLLIVAAFIILAANSTIVRDSALTRGEAAARKAAAARSKASARQPPEQRSECRGGQGRKGFASTGGYRRCRFSGRYVQPRAQPGGAVARAVDRGLCLPLADVRFLSERHYRGDPDTAGHQRHNRNNGLRAGSADRSDQSHHHRRLNPGPSCATSLATPKAPSCSEFRFCSGPPSSR